MVDKIDGKKEQVQSSPKVDIEITHPRIARQVDKEFSQYIENKDEWKEAIDGLRGESKKLNRNIMEKIEKQFEDQVSSGEILTIMAKLEEEIGAKGYEEVRRNRGAGLVIPMQLMLRELGYKLEVDGFDGDITKAAIEDFKKNNRIIDKVTYDTTMKPVKYGVDLFTTLRERYTEKFSEKGAASTKESIAKKELSPEEKKELENTRYKKVLIGYFMNSLTRPKLSDILPTSKDRGAFRGIVPTYGNEDIRLDGVKSVAYGPNIRRDNTTSWLDLSKFDLEKNSKIDLIAHTNNGFETSFTVDVKDITYTNSNKELKMNLPILYQKTSVAISTGYMRDRMGAQVG